MVDKKQLLFYKLVIVIKTMNAKLSNISRYRLVYRKNLRDQWAIINFMRSSYVFVL